MFNFELLFLHGFSSKNREILQQVVLTPQEYEDFFWKKIKKKWMEKNLLWVFPQVKISLKKTSRQNNSFLEKALFAETIVNDVMDNCQYVSKASQQGR